MNLPSFEAIYSQFACLISKRSTCRRLQVGCVITDTEFRQVLAHGYNGNVAGGPNDCDLVGEQAVGACGCIHAEANAVVHCASPSRVEKIVFVTHVPCVPCAKLLIQLGGVEELYYLKEYRIMDSVDWLKKAGIAVLQLK